MKTRFSVLTGFRKSSNVKTCLTAGLIVGVCLLGATPVQAGLSFVGNGFIELSNSQNSPSYTSVGNVTTDTGFGFSLGNLSNITLGQTLYLGAQIQTFPQQNGNATLFYRIGTSGNYSAITLAYYQFANNNNWWDSNGSINSPHTYGSLNIASGLTYGSSSSPFVNEVDIYFSATDTDTTTTRTEGSAAHPYSFTVTAVPEPITLALPIFGGLVLTAGGVRRFVISRRANPLV